MTVIEKRRLNVAVERQYGGVTLVVDEAVAPERAFYAAQVLGFVPPDAEMSRYRVASIRTAPGRATWRWFLDWRTALEVVGTVGLEDDEPADEEE